MKNNLRWVPIIFLSIAALACNLTRMLATATPEFTLLETQAQQTLSARLTQGVPSATAPGGVIPTATAPEATLTAAVPTATSEPPTAIPPTSAPPVVAPIATLVPAVVIVPPPGNPPPWNPPPVWPTQPIPQPPPRPVAGRISFANGATSGQASGQLPGSAVVDYLISAGRGQTMLVSVYSPNNDVLLGVSGVSDGQPLLRPAAGQTSFTGVLPATQDYRLTLAAPPPGSSYTVQAIIPARIQFAPGAIAASIPGSLSGSETNYYLARASGGQTMTVRILSPYNNIFLTIYGMTDGSPLVRSVMGQSEWSGVLPLNQDYMIQAVNTGGSSGYTLEVVIQ